MNPVPYSLVLPPNYPHSIGWSLRAGHWLWAGDGLPGGYTFLQSIPMNRYSPTGVDLVVLGCAELLGSGDLFWGLVGRAGLC